MIVVHGRLGVGSCVGGVSGTNSKHPKMQTYQETAKGDRVGCGSCVFQARGTVSNEKGIYKTQKREIHSQKHAVVEENTDFGQTVNLPLPSESIPGRKNGGAGKREKRDHPRRGENKCKKMAAGVSVE